MSKQQSEGQVEATFFQRSRPKHLLNVTAVNTLRSLCSALSCISLFLLKSHLFVSYNSGTSIGGPLKSYQRLRFGLISVQSSCLHFKRFQPPVHLSIIIRLKRNDKLLIYKILSVVLNNIWVVNFFLSAHTNLFVLFVQNILSRCLNG